MFNGIHTIATREIDDPLLFGYKIRQGGGRELILFAYKNNNNINVINGRNFRSRSKTIYSDVLKGDGLVCVGKVLLSISIPKFQF